MNPSSSTSNTSSKSLDTNESPTRKIKLWSTEAKEGSSVLFSLDYHVACQSKLIHAVLDDTTTNEITIPIQAKTMEYIVTFLKYHQHVPIPTIPKKPLPCSDLGKIISSEWDLAWLKQMDIHVLCSVMAAANYLAIIPMLDLLGAAIAQCMRDKNPEQLQQLFKPNTDTSVATVGTHNMVSEERFQRD